MGCREATVRQIVSQQEGRRYGPIREAVARDAQEAAYLRFMTRRELLSLQQRRFTASWDGEGQQPRVYFNAFVGAHLVGLADLITQTNPWAGYVMVEPLYVHPRCWPQGVGRKLWEACISAAQSLRTSGVHVVSLDQNEIAKPFYEKTLELQRVSSEWLIVEGHVFQATRYEVPNWKTPGRQG